MKKEQRKIFKSALALKGLTETELASKLNIHRATLSKKIHGKSEWTLSEIKAIAKILGRKNADSIFFDKKVAKTEQIKS